MKTIKAYLREMRPEHYIKNALLFIPLFFSGRMLGMELVLKLLLTFLFFSLICSSIYFINDLRDYQQDLKHPVKKNRPIAAGLIKRSHALVFACLLFATGFAGCLWIHWQCALAAGLYFLLNLAYSLWLKKVHLLDVFCIALGFILRIFVGSTAVDVVVSNWLLLTVLCLALFLAFGKRRNEILFAKPEGETRKVLKSYNHQFLEKSMFSMMTLSITFYSLWSLDAQQRLPDDRLSLLFTVPLVILALLRYMSIVEESGQGDPTYVILKDKFLLILALVLVVLMGVILYV